MRIFYKDPDDLGNLSSASITTKEGHPSPLSAIVIVDLVWKIEEIARVYRCRTFRLNIHSDGTRETVELIPLIQNALDAAAGEIVDGIQTRFSPEASG